MQSMRGTFGLQLPDSAHLCRQRHFRDLWRTVPILVVDGGGFSTIRFRSVENAYRIFGGPWRIGIAGGTEVATGSLHLLSGFISLHAHRLWRAAQNARQHCSISTLSGTDAR